MLKWCEWKSKLNASESLKILLLFIEPGLKPKLFFKNPKPNPNPKQHYFDWTQNRFQLVIKTRPKTVTQTETQIVSGQQPYKQGSPILKSGKNFTNQIRNNSQLIEVIIQKIIPKSLFSKIEGANKKEFQNQSTKKLNQQDVHCIGKI